jgi:hypothetical protein
MKNVNKPSFFKKTSIIGFLALASINFGAAADTLPYTISVMPSQPTPAEIWPNNTNYPYGTDKTATSDGRFTKTLMQEVPSNAATFVTIYQPAPSSSGALPASSPVVVYVHGYGITDPRAAEDFFGHLTRRGYTVLFLTYARMDIWDAYFLGTQNQQVYNSTKYGLNILKNCNTLPLAVACNGHQFIQPTYETFQDNASAGIVKANNVKYVTVAHSVGGVFAAINADMAEFNRNTNVPATDINAPAALVFHDISGASATAYTFWLQLGTYLTKINPGHTKTALMLASETYYRRGLLPQSDGLHSDTRDSLLSLYKGLPLQGQNKLAYIVPTYRYPDPATNLSYTFSTDINPVGPALVTDPIQPGMITEVKDAYGNIVVVDETSNHHGSLSWPGNSIDPTPGYTTPDQLNSIDIWGYWLQTTAVIDYAFKGINDRFFRAVDPSVDPLWNGASIFQRKDNLQWVTQFNKKVPYPIANPVSQY